MKENSLFKSFSNLNLKLLILVLDALSSKIIVQLSNIDAWKALITNGMSIRISLLVKLAIFKLSPIPISQSSENVPSGLKNST